MDMEVTVLILRLMGAFVCAGIFMASTCGFFWLLQAPDSYPDRTFRMYMRVAWMVVAMLIFCLCAIRTQATIFC
jgi:hypothetical protein